MRGVARFGAAGAPYVDPLSALDDDFLGVGLNPKWSIYKPASTPGITVGGGYCRIPIVQGNTGATGSFWFDTDNGVLLYQDCPGDFDAIVFGEARDELDAGPCTTADFKIIGLAAHDPANPPYNYVHVGLGSNTTGSLQAEHKSTSNSVSTFSYLPNASGSAWIRLLRVGQIFTTFFGPTSAGPWTTIDVVNRSVAVPPIPNTVRLGLMTYSNNAIAGGNILGRFNNFTVRTP